MRMTYVTRCLFVLLLSLVAFAFTINAPKAHATSGGTTFVLRFQGISALAVFGNLSPDGCIDTFVGLLGTQNTVNHQTLREADIRIGQFDLCTNTQLLAASGFAPNPNFQIDNNLLSASLDTIISVTDSVSGNTFNVSVSMTWTSTSALTHEKTNFHLHTQTFTENGSFSDDFRSASASGTVSDGTTNFTPSPANFARTISTKDDTVTITHA